MDEAKLVEIVEQIAEVDAGSVTLETTLDEIDWDSLCNIGFIAEVDSAASVTLNAEELARATTVRDLYGAVQSAVTGA